MTQAQLTPDEALALIGLADDLRTSELITRPELLSAIDAAGDWPGVDWPHVSETIAALDDAAVRDMREVFERDRHSPDLLGRVRQLAAVGIVSLDAQADEEEPMAGSASLLAVATWSDTPLNDVMQIRKGRIQQLLRTLTNTFRQPEPRH